MKIGTNAVIIAPRGRSLRIGRGARIGAGAIVTDDVPAGASVVSPPSRFCSGMRTRMRRRLGAGDSSSEHSLGPSGEHVAGACRLHGDDLARRRRAIDTP